MTPLSILGLLISIAAIGFAWQRITIGKLALSIMLLLVHVVASVYYFYYSQVAAADASAYYYDPLNLGPQPWGLSTKFVVQLCYVLKTQFGASYLDCFLIFQALGFAGLMILVRVFDEIEWKVGVPERKGYVALLLLPSVNFWTAAIGKDAPMFFAVSLCVWSMLSVQKRFLYFAISLAVMVMFRAHVALMAAMAMAGASMFGTNISAGRKMGLTAIGMLAIWATSGAVQSSFGVDATSVSSVTDYINQQNDAYDTVGGTTSMGDASYPMRVVSLLFRPLFFDAHGILGIVASFENVAVVIAFLYAAVHWRDVLFLIRHVPFVRFVAMFAFVLLFALTLVYYNVGLGLRERVMAYPMVYSLLVALWSIRRKRALVTAPPQPAQNLMPAGNANRPLTEP